MKKLQASEEFVVGKHGIGYVYSDFISQVGDVEFEQSSEVGRFQTLSRTMDDFQIEAELKPGNCTLGDVVAFMENAPEGCKDGYANLFYLAGCVVCVYWYAGGREWGVSAWRRDGSRWHAGRRVFSPATDTGPVSAQPSDSVPFELTINGHLYRRV